MDMLRDLLAGTVGGVAGIVVTQPLDIIRIRMQTWGSAETSSIGATARGILRSSGWKGFFNGMAPPLIANAPINAIVFAAEVRRGRGRGEEREREREREGQRGGEEERRQQK